MHFLKKNINGSPFLGIFCAVSDKLALVPTSISKKEETEIANALRVKVIKTTIANSSLLGVMAALFDNKIVVGQMIEKSEKKFLEEKGIEIISFREPTAFGNLVAFNENHGIASTLLSKNAVKEMEAFFGVPIEQKDIAGSNLVGACVEVTGKAFIVNPKVNEKEFEFLEKAFGVPGVATTANYGDRFVGNDIVANSFGALIGSITTTHEMIRIDEAFRRD